VSTTSIAVRVILDHAHAAADDGHQHLDQDDPQHAAIRLLEASKLYRLAARHLNPDIHPIGLIVAG
jgi:hypothetical protein